ncbi:hypothetical protein SALBM135S_00340 [Streptomyces alboniger]
MVVEVEIGSLSAADSPRTSGVDQEHVEALAVVETPLPPITVHRPTMRVIDGLHRLRAAELRGQRKISVKYFDGAEDDAFVLAVESNVTHGLPLTTDDRKSAAARIIASHPQWSDRMIASVSGIAAGTVADIRRRDFGGGPGDSSRIGHDGRVRPVNGAEGRRIASELIARDPTLSLRQVARVAAISPETVRDVRNRMMRGEDPLTRRGRQAQGEDAAEAVIPRLGRAPSAVLEKEWRRTVPPPSSASRRTPRCASARSAARCCACSASTRSAWRSGSRSSTRFRRTAGASWRTSPRRARRCGRRWRSGSRARSPSRRSAGRAGDAGDASPACAREGLRLAWGHGRGQRWARPGRALPPRPAGQPTGCFLDLYGPALRMGCFDWDLDTGLMTMDATAHDVFDIRPDEYDDRPETLAARVPTAEGHRLDQTVARALKDGSETYGAYFRVRHRDGALRWTHTHGCIRRDGTGRPHRIVGVVRDATRELGDSPPALRERADEEAERRRRTSLVQNTTAALAHARTVSDVIDVLKDTHGLAHLVIHLARAGWLQWRDPLPEGLPRPGKGPLALRVALDTRQGFDLTEAGTQKRLAVYVTPDPAEIEGVARLGPDPFAPDFDEERFAALLAGERRPPPAGAVRARRPGGAHRGPAHDQGGGARLGRGGAPTRSSWSPTR